MARPRVVISTDIGGMDNDDAQSLIHALYYANDVRYVGIVNTRTDDGGIVGGKPRDGLAMVDEILDAYAADVPALRNFDGNYPTANYLRDIVRAGAVDGTFPGTLSDGAKLIVSEAKKASPQDPLYILTWGPIHDAAAAILSDPDIVPNVRLFSISGWAQDKKNTAALDALENAIATDPEYKDLWWINSEDSHMGFYMTSGGMYHGINSLRPWALDNFADSGAMAELMLEKYVYNVHTWSPPAESPDGLKLGDTTSLLYLLDNVNDDTPGAGGWAGKFVKSGLGTNTWVDDLSPQYTVGGYPGVGSVIPHRPDFLADWAERLDWAKPGSEPQPPSGVDLVRMTPDSNGIVRIGAGALWDPTKIEVRGLDLADGDRIVLASYDNNTFNEIAGGNPLVVSANGRYAEIKSLADIRELDMASGRVSVDADTASGVLTVSIARQAGRHDVDIHGAASDYAAAYGDDAPAGAQIVTPYSDGVVKFGGGQLVGSTRHEVRQFDFGDGDHLVFTAYDEGTFRQIPGGNTVVVSSNGRYADLDSLADVAELAAASSRVSASVDLTEDLLILTIDKGDFEHEVAIRGHGADYASDFL